LLNSTYRRDAHLSKNIRNDTQNEASAHPRNSFCYLYQFYGNGLIVIVLCGIFLIQFFRVITEGQQVIYNNDPHELYSKIDLFFNKKKIVLFEYFN